MMSGTRINHFARDSFRFMVFSKNEDKNTCVNGAYVGSHRPHKVACHPLFEILGEPCSEFDLRPTLGSLHGLRMPRNLLTMSNANAVREPTPSPGYAFLPTPEPGGFRGRKEKQIVEALRRAIRGARSIAMTDLVIIPSVFS
jgi:hypothetical protein